MVSKGLTYGITHIVLFQYLQGFIYIVQMVNSHTAAFTFLEKRMHFMIIAHFLKLIHLLWYTLTYVFDVKTSSSESNLFPSRKSKNKSEIGSC